jgi:hypothetical protein
MVRLHAERPERVAQQLRGIPGGDDDTDAGHGCQAAGSAAGQGAPAPLG